jgi:hypothetical protein
VSRLVFEANGKSELRKDKFILLLAGPVTVISCTAAERDAIEK